MAVRQEGIRVSAIVPSPGGTVVSAQLSSLKSVISERGQ
ncbi:hypothetical protein EMIT0P12_30325 [Pseudomonas sp. IT-P12]